MPIAYSKRATSAPFRVGDVKAKGWLLEQINTDLNEGYLSCFDHICPYINQDIFNSQRVLSESAFKDYPYLNTWWGAEEEAYLKDGILRMAIQSGHQYYLAKAGQWMERLLKYQDEDGYIGMYLSGDEENTRYNHKGGDNGELWVQSRIFSALLSWYEYTNDSRFLEAVDRAAQLSIKEYTEQSVFPAGGRYGGISHAVGFFDSLEWLYRLTGNSLYKEFAKKMYQDFNDTPPRDNDLTIENLLKEDVPFDKHTPHIAEGLYMAQYVASLYNDAELQRVADIALTKTQHHSTPGGGIVGDENVKGRQGTVDMYREYCGLPELMYSLNRILTLTGNTETADMVERVIYNAAQGARLPDLKGLQYLSSDNRVEINKDEHAGRLAYDANRYESNNGKNLKEGVFRQGAVCCVTSAARVIPYFIDGMWMRSVADGGVVAMQYAPTEISFEIDNTNVNIDQQTNYPFSDDVTFVVNAEKPLTFNLHLRIPDGAVGVDVQKVKGLKVTKSDDFVILSKRWGSNDEVKVSFEFEVEKIEQPDSKSVKGGGLMLKRGALLYSLQFPHKLVELYDYNNTGYYPYDVVTLDKRGWDYSIDPKAEFTLKTNDKADYNKPWFDSPVYLEGNLVDANGQEQKVRLVPEGSTILRRVAFPLVNQ
ncbi:MAG: glycoside hydrolase family 127 protein [Rikenellaceae bacterium]